MLKAESAKSRVRELEESVNGAPYIISEYNVGHKVFIRGPHVKPANWKNKCGYLFGIAVYKDAYEVPSTSKMICGSCMPEEKRRAKELERQASEVPVESSASDD